MLMPIAIAVASEFDPEQHQQEMLDNHDLKTESERLDADTQEPQDIEINDHSSSDELLSSSAACEVRLLV